MFQMFDPQKNYIYTGNSQVYNIIKSWEHSFNPYGCKYKKKLIIVY